MSAAVRRLVACVLACLWIAALTQPVATTRHLAGDQTFSGMGIVFLGIIGPLELMFSWYANPLLALGLMLSLKPSPRLKRTYIMLSALIALLVVNAALWRRIPDDSGENPIIQYYAGYWLWMATMALASAWFATLGFSSEQATADPARSGSSDTESNSMPH